jgi:short-subunit dehydrogenase
MPTLSVKYSPATGASRGIGTAIPKRLAAEGTSLAVT